MWSRAPTARPSGSSLPAASCSATPCRSASPACCGPATTAAGGSPSSTARSRMQFSPELRPRVADGTITVSYRLWARPQVKGGGTYRTAGVAIEVDDMELLPFSTITDEDLVRTGEPDLATLRSRAAHAGPIDDDTLVYRVEFHVVGRT